MCVAIIGKENDPLYIRTWLENVNVSAPLPGQIAAEPSLKFHYHVHTSLDVIEEKVNPNRRAAAAAAAAALHSTPAAAQSGGGSSGGSGELYLGQLFSVEEYKVFGYITNTKIKLVAVIHETAGDVSLRQVSSTTHTQTRSHRARKHDEQQVDSLLLCDVLYVRVLCGVVMLLCAVCCVSGSVTCTGCTFRRYAIRSFSSTRPSTSMRHSTSTCRSTCETSWDRVKDDTS